VSGRDLVLGAVLLVVLSVFPVAWNLGGPPVTDLMEVRNLVTAREMVDTGRWLIPTMNGALRVEKPPLPTWVAAAAGIAGDFRNLWAMRAPTVLMGILGALAVAVYTRRLGASPVAALAAGLVLVSMFLYARHARQATWDVPTHAFAMAGIAAFVEAGRRRGPAFAVLSALFLSASFLSKGPVAFGVIVLPWAVSAAIWDPSLLHARRSHIAIVLVLTAIGSVAWPLYVFAHEPGHAVAVALREADAWVNRHARPVWSYSGFPVFAGAWIPAALAVLASPIFFREFFSRRDVRAAFAWLWLSLLVVSLVPAKKERYLIPVLFPLAILIALWWDREGRRARSSATRVLRAQFWFAGTAGAAAVCAVPVLFVLGKISRAEGLVAIGLVTAGMAGFVSVGRSRWALPVRAFVGTLTVAFGVMSAGWHMQDRFEKARVPPIGLQDVVRHDGLLHAPFFASHPDDLFLVWTVGRPLLPVPGSRDRLMELAAKAAASAPSPPADPSAGLTDIRAGWISDVPPDAEPVLGALRSQNVTVLVDSVSTWPTGQDRKLFYYSRVRFLTVRPAVTAPRQ